MKFFWKIFFSTVIITLTTFSISSYILMNFTFHSSLDREIEISYEENNILSFSIAHEFKNYMYNYNYSDSKTEDYILSLDSSLSIIASKLSNMNNYKSFNHFRLSNSEYKYIFENTTLNPINPKIIKLLSNNMEGYEIIKINNTYYIHTATTLKLLNKPFYIESVRDITTIFNDRLEQYKMFYLLMSLMLILISIITLLVAKWLTKPISALSLASQKISMGDFNEKVKIYSKDEIGILTKNFNTMTTRTKEMILELQEAKQSQEDFVSNFAHELKTPLTCIIGYADMLRSTKVTEEQTITSSNYIFEEGRRLESLSMKLLDLVILKKHSFTKKKVLSTTFFTSIENIFLPILKKENILLTIHAEKYILKIDPDLMKTVCINLLDNARKSITSNGHIYFIGKQEPDGYCIYVLDNGKGMNEYELSRITEAFYMVDKSRSRKQGSVGLGLTICSEIVNLHNGSMRFHSIPNEGSLISIHL